MAKPTPQPQHRSSTSVTANAPWSTPQGWWRSSAFSRLLGWVGVPYGLVTKRRMRRLDGETVPVPVICVGNFVAGGAGKTPVSIAIAERLWAHDIKPVFLSRGYRGRLTGPLLVDEQEHAYHEVGDEPLLLADHHLTVVAQNRPEGAALAIWLGAEAIVMDDGLQNPSLQKSLSFAVVDGQVGVGNGLVLPMGPLRAPVGEQMNHVDALVVMNYTPAATQLVRMAARRGLPVLQAKTELIGQEHVEGRRLLAFAGLGRPEKFFQSLGDVGAAVVEQRGFPDHHAYSEADAKALLRKAADDKLTLATTAKDAARLRAAEAGPLKDLLDASVVVDVRARFAEPQRLDDLLARFTPRLRPFQRAL